MAYMYLPPKGDKPVVTLLHGKNFNGAYWERTAQFLQKQGYGVLMPDQIGFGKSSKPTGYQYSFPVLANNTRELMKSLDIDNAVIVGHSMGGMLASRFALNYPDATRKLILVNPIGLENYLHFVQYKDVGFFYQNELKQSADKIKAYQRKNYYAGDWNEDYAALTEPLVGWVQGPDWNDLAYVSALTYDMIFTQPVVEEYDDFNVPAALILGTRDRTGPGRNWKKEGVEYELGRYDQLGRAIRARNEDIQLYELEDLGHLPHIEAFDRFKTVFAKALP
ncbi:alpha/beta hydrolase [Marinobacter nanhaiticus D15-8W]|uniref:Alpha/beta hydrolase n=2 Tax=Marinobacter TaxID=2742 RepID=N6VSS6_9GAMM|nr:alpha/beta hydrolase [Marinobacter nanhaiticus D15-8W]